MTVNQLFLSIAGMCRNSQDVLTWGNKCNASKIISFLVCYCSLKEFLPKEYIKVKGIEKKIFAVGIFCCLVNLFICC